MTMISEETRQKMREAHARRIARGEKFGFQKGHPKYRGDKTREEIERQVASFKKNFVKKEYPVCIDCSEKLKERRSVRCGSCANKERARIQRINGTLPTNKGKTWKLNLSPEQKARRTEVGKARVMSVEARQKIRDWHVANPNRVFRDTSIELAIQDELAERQILFIKQFTVPQVARVDFYLPEYNIIIQCDGCFWHNCLEHYPSHHKEQRAKDVTKDSKLTIRGFSVYRFWEHDIKISPKDCVDLLKLE